MTKHQPPVSRYEQLVDLTARGGTIQKNSTALFNCYKATQELLLFLIIPKI